MNEDFTVVYEKINDSFNYVKGMMEVIYDKIKDDPTDEESIKIFEGLGEIALRILYSQREFTYVYANSEEKDYFLDMVEDKINYISNVVFETRSSRSR